MTGRDDIPGPPEDALRGALLGTAVGDALGMPIEGLSHQNVRTYYLGIKEYRDDLERGDLEAGQWTDDTQFTFALVRALTAPVRTDELLPVLAERVVEEYLALRPRARRWGPSTSAAIDRLAEGASWRTSGSAERPTNGAPMRAAPMGVWWALAAPSWEAAFEVVTGVLGITHRHPGSLAAGVGHAFAVRAALEAEPSDLDGGTFLEEVLAAIRRAEEALAGGSAPAAGGDRAPVGSGSGTDAPASTAVGDRLEALRGHLTDTPLDLRDRCGGTGVEADASWPYAVAMFARNPRLIEATLLSGINVGGDADTVGAFLGALLGALHGWSAFPDEWRNGLEEAERLQEEADALTAALHGTRAG